MKIILFDIDGTLLRCDGAGKRSMRRACLEVFGTAGRMDEIDFQGRTDLFILGESLRSAGLAESKIAEKMPAFTERYAAHLTRELETAAVTLLPGVTDLLDALSGAGNAVAGVLTGNIRAGAEIKLDRVGLRRFFPFGAYGDDAADRTLLPAIALERAGSAMGLDAAYGDMVIVGDTVHDIDCARAVDAVSVCVGTGWSGRQVLLERGPDHFFDDLGDTEAVIRTLLS